MKKSTLNYSISLPTIAFILFSPLLTGAKGLRFYTVADLGTLGGPTSFANGISNKGLVVGGATTATPSPFGIDGFAFHGFVWDNGVMTDLGTFGGDSSDATSLNDRGQIAGGSQIEPGSGIHVTMLWDKKTYVIHNLGTLGGPHSAAYAINNHDQLAGHADIPEIGGHPSCCSANVLHAYLWEKGLMRDLGTLGGQNSEAYGINELGQVAGYSETVDPDPFTFFGFRNRGFIHSNGTMIDLGTLGGNNSFASKINNRSQVVGSADTANLDPVLQFPVFHAFLWENGVMRDLGTLGDDPFSFEGAVNNKGQVVGSSFSRDFVFRAFIWENGFMTDLNSLIPADSGWQLMFTGGINESGQIVGAGTNPDGQFHAFLLNRSNRVVVSQDSAQSATIKNNGIARKSLPEKYRWLLERAGVGHGSLGMRRLK